MKIEDFKNLAVTGLEDYVTYFDFSDGKELDLKYKKSFVEQVVERLKEKDVVDISSGNFMVVGFKYLNNDGTYTIRIIVSENYKEFEKSNVEIQNLKESND
ncbi:MAG: hypothetical protein ACOCVF_03460 [bacterium]